jgi:hypothetical protein
MVKIQEEAENYAVVLSLAKQDLASLQSMPGALRARVAQFRKRPRLLNISIEGCHEFSRH